MGIGCIWSFENYKYPIPFLLLPYFSRVEYASACSYLENHYGFAMPDKSNFNRILHKLTDLVEELFRQLGLLFKHL